MCRFYKEVDNTIFLPFSSLLIIDFCGSTKKVLKSTNVRSKNVHSKWF